MDLMMKVRFDERAVVVVVSSYKAAAAVCFCILCHVVKFMVSDLIYKLSSTDLWLLKKHILRIRTIKCHYYDLSKLFSSEF